MRNTLRWALMIVVAIAAVTLIGAPEHAMAMATAVTHPFTTLNGVAGPAMLSALAPIALAGTTRPDVNLASKSREANELRGKADDVMKRIRDTATPMTKEQFTAAKDEYDALNLRANMLAEFDADKEIARQGGDEDLTRAGIRKLASEDGPEVDEKRLTRSKGMEKRINEFADKVKGEFGDVRAFLGIAVAGNPGNRYGQVGDKARALMTEAAALTRSIIGTAGDVSGGEYLLPLTQVSSIFSLSNVQQGIMQRARAYNVPGRTLRIPFLLQDDAAASTTLDRPMAGNIANVTIIGEGSTKAVRAPKFGQRLLTVYKYAAYTQVSDELLSDDFTGELPSEFINAVGQQALNAVNEDITIDGTNSGEPQGALYPGAWNISVARNTGSTIKPDDLFNMYARHTHGPGSVWLISRRVVQALFAMSLTAASLVTFLKNLNETPQMMILGYPVVISDLLPTIGSTGDIALVNPDFYAFALRQALTVELSRDYAFVDDLTTYRFVVRAGGCPINPGLYAYKYSGTSGVDEHSPFVYLHS